MAQFKKAMNDAVSGLKQVVSESRKASKEVDGFTADVNEQRSALNDLKKKYVDLAAAHGKESKEAKEAAAAIRKLSQEYKTNKTLVDDLTDSANSFDASFGDSGKKNVDDTNESVQDLQGSLESIRNLDFANVLLEAFGPDLRKHLRKAKAEFEEVGIHARYAFSGLFKNGSYYKETGEQWTGLGDAIKGMFESGKAAGEAFGNGMKSVGQSVSSALNSVVGVLLVIIADLMILIGLTKNALAVAKEVKAMANQASKSGMETSTYQEWAYVLKQVGIEEDKLVDFTKKLAERQNELRDGSEEAAKAFEAVGISAEEALGSNQEQLFRKTVSALQNVENSAERTSLAFRIFSDDATDLMNILYLNNKETQSLINNYYALGGAPSDNLINKSKILESSTMNLDYAWQGLKNTLAEWVIPAVIAVVQWITTAVAYINVFLQGVFGVEMVGKKAADSLGAVGGGVNNVGSSAKKATSAIKELLRYTMGFDELNVVPKQSTGSDSASTGGASGFSATNINPELPVIEVPDLSEFRAFMTEYGSIIQGILTWSLIAIGVLLAVLGFSSGNIALGILGISLAGLGIGVGAAGGEESHWAKLGQGIMDVISAVGQWFVDTWNNLMGILSTIGSWIYDNVIAPVANFFSWLWQKITEIFAPVANWFGELWASVSASFQSVIDVIVGLFKGGWILIQHVWGIVASWFNDTIIQPVAGFFSGLWEGIKSAASGAWEAIKSVFTPVVEWFKNIFAKAWEGVKNVFSTGGKIFMGIVDGIANVFKTVVNAIITGINKVIAVPFNVINGILNFIKDINIVGIKPFDGLWGYNPLVVPQIPYLAKGGIVDGATLAMIGERGKEAVVPLENNTEWMDKLANKINGSSPSKIVLMLDGNELGWANIRSINSITEQTGELQLTLV